MEMKFLSKEVALLIAVAVGVYLCLAAWFLIFPPGWLVLLISTLLSVAISFFAVITVMKNAKPKRIAIVTAIVSLLLLGAVFLLPAHAISRNVEFQIIATEREQGINGAKGQYMISVRYRDGFTDKLKNTDALVFFKLRSGTLQTKFEEQTNKEVWFSAKIFGFRIGLISSYPNVISAEILK